MIRIYIKTACRNLWKRKGFSALNILGLAVGIACAALIFLWVEDEITYNRWFKKSAVLGQIMTNQRYDQQTYTFASTPGPLAAALKAEVPEIRDAARINWGMRSTLRAGDQLLFVDGIYADPGFLSLFTFDFMQGKPEKALESPYQMVITERLAKKIFHSADEVLGKTIQMDNDQRFVVTGVYRNLPDNSRFEKVDFIIPFSNFEKANPWLQNWGNNGVQTFVEFKPGVDLAQLNTRLAGFIKQKADGIIAEPLVLAMKDWRLRNNFVQGVQSGGKIKQVNMFSLIAWIIILLACINFMNLATARSEQRAREVGVRKVLGSGRGSLIGQFLGEAFIMSVLAMAVAVALTLLSLPAFNGLVEKNLELNVFAPSHLLAIALVIGVCTLVAGSYPAFYLSSFQPMAVLKGMRIPIPSGAAFIRRGLVTVQFVISIALITCTLVIYQQIMHTKNRELGMNRENLLVMDQRIVSTRQDSSTAFQFRTLRQALDATGVVAHAALNTNNPFSVGSNSSNYSWKGKDPNSEILIGMDFITPEYISTMGMQVLAGRDFRKDSPEDSASILINESMAKLIAPQPEDVVGKVIQREEDNLVVVGVVRNFIYNNMYGAAEPVIFYNDQQASYTSVLNIRLKPTKDLSASLGAVRVALEQHNPHVPVEWRFADEEFDKLFVAERLMGTLAALFAGLAIFISCLGLLGLAAYTAERRLKEIGIRKVLGTSTAGIVKLLSADFMRLVLLSCVVAFPIAWWLMHTWLQEFSYRVSIQWWMFFLPGLLALFIALLTVSSQAIRAALMNPIKALRTE